MGTSILNRKRRWRKAWGRSQVCCCPQPCNDEELKLWGPLWLQVSSWRQPPYIGTNSKPAHATRPLRATARRNGRLHGEVTSGWRKATRKEGDCEIADRQNKLSTPLGIEVYTPYSSLRALHCGAWACCLRNSIQRGERNREDEEDKDLELMASFPLRNWCSR
jgi:hypothetical protein